MVLLCRDCTKNILTLSIVLLIFRVELSYSSDIEETTSFSIIDTTESEYATDRNNNVSETEKLEKPFLLPTSVKPVNYRLEIIPLLFDVDNQKYSHLNVSKFSAPGKIWISIACSEKTFNITLHAHEDVLIDTDRIKVFNSNTNETVTVNNVTRDNETDFLVLHLNESIGNPLDEDKHGEVFMVYIEFVSRIADDRLNGLYLDYYIDPTSQEKRFLSTTLFAPNHARKAFPCFDSPGFKATFDISIGRKVDSNFTSISNMPTSHSVPIHEISHQWFGNMLTPKSWTYVWLKESFSDFLGALYLSQKSGINFDELFANQELQKAMRFDAGANTHPLENHIKSAAAVADIYTDIPYRKGASIVYMISNFLTKEVFHHGLQSLFDAKVQKSGKPKYDLFEILEQKQQENNILESQGLPNVTVKDILNSWTQKSGYPIVRARREGSSLVLTQEKFKNGLLIELQTRDVNETENMNGTDSEESFWYIPITVADGMGKHSAHWLHPNSGETIINNTVQGKFHLISRIPLGYFRVLYSNDDLQRILKNLKHFYTKGELAVYHHPEMSTERVSSFLKPVERSQLVDDYFAFALSGYEQVPLSELFNVLSTILPYEGEPVVWKTILTNMEKPYNLLQNTEYFDAFRNYFTRFLKPLSYFLQSQIPVISHASCSQPSQLTRKMKLLEFHSLVLSWLCKLDPEECSHLSQKSVLKFMESGDILMIHPDEQSILYCNAVKTASERELETFWSFFEKQYFEEPYSEQRNKYLKALSCVTRQSYLERLLTWTTNETLDFHDVDRVQLLKNVISNPVGRDVVLKFLDVNFKVLYKSKSVANPVTESLKFLVDYCNSNENLKKMDKFIETHKDEMEKKKKFLEKQIKNSKLNILWMELFAESFQQNANSHLKNEFIHRTICSL